MFSIGCLTLETPHQNKASWDPQSISRWLGVVVCWSWLCSQGPVEPIPFTSRFSDTMLVPWNDRSVHTIQISNTTSQKELVTHLPEEMVVKHYTVRNLGTQAKNLQQVSWCLEYIPMCFICKTPGFLGNSFKYILLQSFETAHRRTS